MWVGTAMTNRCLESVGMPSSLFLLGVLWQTNLSHDSLRSHDLFSNSVLSHTRQSSRSWSVAGAQVYITTEDKEATVHREMRDTSEDWKPILVSHSHTPPRIVVH